MYLSKPATERQKEVARDLGIEFPRDITWGELHLLMIKKKPRMLRIDPPTPSQLDLARRLGIEVEPGTVTKTYLVALINDTIETQTQDVLRNNPAVKTGNTIRYDGGKYVIKKLGTINSEKWQAMLVPVGGGRHRVVRIPQLATAELVEGPAS